MSTETKNHVQERCRISNLAERLGNQLSDMLETSRYRTFYVCGQNYATTIKAKKGMVEVSHMDSTPIAMPLPEFMRRIRTEEEFGGICPLDEQTFALLNQGNSLTPALVWPTEQDPIEGRFVERGLYI